MSRQGNSKLTFIDLPSHLLSKSLERAPNHQASLGRPFGDGSKSHTPSENPNPHKNRLKRVVYLPRNGAIGFDPQPFEGRLVWSFRHCIVVKGTTKFLKLATP